MKSAVNAMK